MKEKKNNYYELLLVISVSSTRPPSWRGFGGGSKTPESRRAGQEAGRGREALPSPGPLGSLKFPSDLSMLSIGLGTELDRDPGRGTQSEIGSLEQPPPRWWRFG